MHIRKDRLQKLPKNRRLQFTGVAVDDLMCARCKKAGAQPALLHPNRILRLVSVPIGDWRRLNRLCRKLQLSDSPQVLLDKRLLAAQFRLIRDMAEHTASAPPADRAVRLDPIR